MYIVRIATTSANVRAVRFSQMAVLITAGSDGRRESGMRSVVRSGYAQTVTSH